MLLKLAVLLAGVCVALAQFRDVCVLGGGASGMATAVFLKDRGYNPIVLEAQSRVGGHCNTLRTPGRGVGYVDSGVLFLINSTYANATEGRGKGRWALGSIEFASRFLGPQAIVPVDFTSGANSGTSYVLDLSKGGFQAPAQSPDQAQEQQRALTANIIDMYTYMTPYADWLVAGEFPEEIPAELLRPFLQLVAERNWWVFVTSVGFNLLQGSGFAPLEKLTVLEALTAINPVVLDMFTRPGAAFGIGGGCQNLYDAMSAYIGAENIVVNANVRSVLRPRVPSARTPIVVQGFIEANRNGEARVPTDLGDSTGRSTRPAQPFNYRCQQVVVAFYPLLQNLGAMQLSDEETELFEQLAAHYYLSMVLNFTAGSLASEPGLFTIFNYNLTNLPTLQPALPSLSIVSRIYPGVGGLTGAWANADGPLPIGELLEAVRRDLRVLEGTGILGNATIATYDYHYYAPFWTGAAVSSSPNAFSRFRALQGKRGTHWVGAASAWDATPVVWNQAYKLVTSSFPVKTVRA